MGKLDISTLLRFLDTIGTRNTRFRHRGRTTTCMLFNNQHSLRTMVGGTEFELAPMSARLVFERKVSSVTAALMEHVVGTYLALSCRVGVEPLFGKVVTLSMPGYELVGKLRASRFDEVMNYMTGRHYCQFMVLSMRAINDCGTCNNRSGGRRCLDSCQHKQSVRERRA